MVEGEIAQREAALRPTVDRLASDFQEHRAWVREASGRVTEVGRAGVHATHGSIEALGLADVEAGKVIDALDHAAVARARAEDASALADRSVVDAERTAQRLSELWRSRASTHAIIDAIELRFRVDEWTLDDPAHAIAIEVARRLRENPDLIVQLEGYADDTGAGPHNLVLSRLRADAVVLFLAAQGVEPHRLHAIGLGPRVPLPTTGRGTAAARIVESSSGSSIRPDTAARRRMSGAGRREMAAVVTSRPAGW